MATWNIEWDLLDETGAPVGALRSFGGGVTWDGRGAIQRVVRGARFDADDWRQVNPFRDRLRLMFVTDDGTRTPMGVFHVAQLPRTFIDADELRSPEPYLVDGGFFLSQESRVGFAGRLGESLSQVMERVCDAAGVLDRRVTDTTEVCGQPIVAPPGERYSDFLTGLTRLANFLPPHFDRNGTLVLAPVPPLTATPAARYGPTNIVRESRVADDNLLDAPNVFVVVGSGATNEPIVATVEIPSSAPHSVQNRGGREVVAVVREQGIDTDQQARRMAASLALVDATDYESVVFDALPDPAHDCYSLVDVNGVRYRERQWEMPLRVAGATMRHTVDRSDPTEGDVR